MCCSDSRADRAARGRGTALVGNWLVAISVLTVACGGDSGPRKADLTPGGEGGSSGGSGGSSGSSGGGGGGGSGGSGGSSGSSGSGGSSGSSGSSGSGGSGAATKCAGAGSFDAKRVYLNGVLGEGGPESCVGLARPDMPLAVCAGFGVTIPGLPLVHPTSGHVVYLHGDSKDVRVFQPDAFVPGKQQTWACDMKGTDDDPVLATPACAGAPVLAFMLAPDDGALVYACDGLAGWHTASGDLALPLGVQLVALGRDGTKLVRAPTQPSDVLSVMTSSGEIVGAVKLDPSAPVVRAAADGFTVARRLSADAWEQWHIASSGVGTMTGTYSGLPIGMTAIGVPVLDGDGALWQTVWESSTNQDYVIVRSVSAPTKLAYSPKDVPLVDWAATPPIVWVSWANVGLLTGP